MAANLDKKAKSAPITRLKGARSRAGLPSSGAKPGGALLVDSPSPKADAERMRRIIIEQSYRAGVGHIGSALSVVDILAALYDRVLRIPSTGHPDRDRFVLSKGHAALALYAALHLK